MFLRFFIDLLNSAQSIDSINTEFNYKTINSLTVKRTKAGSVNVLNFRPLRKYTRWIQGVN